MNRIPDYISHRFIMKRSALLFFLISAIQGMSQTLPFRVTIPDDPALNPTEASDFVEMSNWSSNGGVYVFRVMPKRYSHNPTTGSTGENNFNFIRVEQAYFNYDANGLASANPDQKAMSYQYFDGLGRLMQTIDCKGSPNFKDVIKPVVYDGFGRVVLDYLPYTNNNDGRYQPGAVADQAAFYSTSTPYKYKVKTDAAPYARSVYDASPLNRVMEQGAPGTVWQPDLATPSNGKTIKMQLLTNVDGTASGQEKIKVWTVSKVTISSNVQYIVSSTSDYPTGSLSINATTDEQGRQIREYSDKQGKVILKKVQYVDSSPALNNDSHWTLTYYIHDEFERLRFVLQPKFMDRLSTYNNAGTTTAGKKDILDSLAFEYRYDERGRMRCKKVPGADSVEMVYDQWDRLVLTRDGNQRAAGKWSFTKYDHFNRPIITGEYASSNTISTMRSQVGAFAGRYESTASGNNVGYTLSATYPTTVSLDNIFTITYYDDYGYKSRLGLASAYDISIPSGFSGTFNNRVKGQVTGSKVKVLETTTWLISSIYYDDYGRVLQTVGDDVLGNKNRTTNEYYGITSWATKTRLDHGTSLTILTETEYDHRGRVQKTWQTMDSGSPVLMASNKYNEVGQLVEKNVHSTDDGNTFLQSTDYRYNIRGWMTHINNSTLTNNGTVNDDTNDLFGMELKYETSVTVNGTATDAQYNGNISAIQWKTNNLKDTPKEKIYGFSYDALNRLEDARYATKSGSSWTADADLFKEAMTYDRNGNIMTLNRKASIDGANVFMDQLAYKYKGNTLINVQDNSIYYSGSNNAFGFKETIHDPAVTEYSYDQNGSMIADLNKEITSITYNHMNLPRLVTLSGSRTMEYIYDATGTKLKSVARSGGNIISQTVYVGPIHYEGTTTPELKFVATSEGRVVKDGSTWNYEYFHKDHLGNNRVVYGYQKQVDSYKATMETIVATGEQAIFKNVAATRVTGFNHTIANHQYTSPDQSAETNGYIAGKAVGPAKMIQVSMGDRVELEVFARYVTGTGPDNSLITTLASAVTTAFGLSSGEAAYSAIHNDLPGHAATIGKTTNVPKAYLCYILFNSSHAFQQFGYYQVHTDAEAGHERLYLDVVMPASGYLYTFVANESDVSTATSVYFDDFSIVHSKTTSALQVLQTQDYYPFGLQFNSYTTENSTANHYKFNGKEEQNAFGLGWLDFGARMYANDIGRWGVIDPYADIYESISPYSYVENNPTIAVDPDGRLVIYVNGFRPGAYFKWYFHPIDADPIFGVPPPHEWNPVSLYAEDPFDYWNEFRKNWNFENPGEENYFVDGSNHAESTASDRFAKGKREGEALAQKIKSGEITLQDGELIKLIGHSMGAAHSIGMAVALIDKGIDPALIKIFLFAPHQPNQLGGIEGVEIFQFGRDGDKVSSKGIMAFLTNSEHSRIPGSDWVVVPNRPEEPHGGHYVQTFTMEEVKQANPGLFKYLVDSGLINEDGTLK